MTDQRKTWQKVEEIGDAEGRVNVSVSATGITSSKEIQN